MVLSDSMSKKFLYPSARLVKIAALKQHLK